MGRGARRAGIALAGAGLLLAACGADKKTGRMQTIRLHARQVTIATIPNQGPANAWAFGSILTDAHGARVGAGQAYCVASPRRLRPSDDPKRLAEGRGALRICVESLEFQDGQIAAQGEVLLDGVRTMPVVGGTGAYAGAIGTLRTTATRRGDQEIVILVGRR